MKNKKGLHRRDGGEPPEALHPPVLYCPDAMAAIADGAAKAAAGTRAPLYPSLGNPNAAGLAQRIPSSNTNLVA
jgi:hypothetical protein